MTEEAKTRFDGMTPAQLKNQIQHLTEEIEFLRYQAELSARGVEMLDSSLKWELRNVEQDKEELIKKIDEEENQVEAEYMRSKLWFMQRDIDGGLNLKAIRKRKELLGKNSQCGVLINNYAQAIGTCKELLNKNKEPAQQPEV